MSNYNLHSNITRGVYPEKEARRMNFAERLNLRLQGIFRRYRYTKQSQLQSIAQRVIKINQGLHQLSDQKLNLIIQNHRFKLNKKGLHTDNIIYAFALIREMAKRKLGMQHHAVQIMGGWVMMHGMLAEMDTGEGKTLTATLPVCTAALAGIPVHIITVNDYLVARDAELMLPLYEALELTVGVITEKSDFNAKYHAYRCDITYCTNKRIAFDYLQDRLKMRSSSNRLQLQFAQLPQQIHHEKQRLLMRGLSFAIVDEADSVLVDESRTPLIIAQENHDREQEQTYRHALILAKKLQQGKDYQISILEKNIKFTEHGIARLNVLTQSLQGIWSGQRRRQYLVSLALNGLHFFIRDKNYLIKDGKLQTIDEHTGRATPDRAWQHGLQQILECKEGCALTGQKETLAQITYQRFFRHYLHLSGMTGTAKEVSDELCSVYNLNVVKIPTHQPCKRIALPKRVYYSEEKKWCAIISRIREMHKNGRPVLVGTRSVASSEFLSHLLNKENLNHFVLNANQNKHEAEIIAQAGEPGNITVATNMAGRGTDIKLACDVAAQGGLHVILTELNDAGRIDRQLVGRCARQGDPGSYEAILSLEDEPIAAYYPAIFHVWLSSLPAPLPPYLSKIITWLPQRAIENNHKQARYNLLKYDQQLDRNLGFTGRQ